MGEAKRKRKFESEDTAASFLADCFQGVIDLHMLPPVVGLTLGRIRILTGRK